MLIEMVPAMDQQPACCLLCNQTPTRNGKPLPSATVRGLDVNWGDSVFICWNCINIMADLVGRVDQDKAKKSAERNKFLEKRLTQVSKELSDAEDRIERMLDGNKAVKESRKASKKKGT